MQAKDSDITPSLQTVVITCYISASNRTCTPKTPSCWRSRKIRKARVAAIISLEGQVYASTSCILFSYSNHSCVYCVLNLRTTYIYIRITLSICFVHNYLFGNFKERISFNDPGPTQHVSFAISTWPRASWWYQHRLGTQHTMFARLETVLWNTWWPLSTSPCTQTWCFCWYMPKTFGRRIRNYFCIHW